MDDPIKRRVSQALPVIERITEICGSSGVSLAVSDLGQTLASYHLGYMDLQSNARANSDTVYCIDSMTKSMVAALVGIEIFNGTKGLTWTTRIKEVLPEFKLSVEYITDNCTIIDLLCHRSGISGFDEFWIGSHNVVYLARDQALRTFAKIKPAVPFRTSFEYNNWGYEILGQVLEQITGEKLSDLLHEKLFEPLGMTRTSTSWDIADLNAASYYIILENSSPFAIPRPSLGKGTIMEAAGGIKSTLHDLNIYYASFLKAVKFQFATQSDETPESVFKCCRTLVSGYTRFAGLSLTEQGYGAGWARCQLPGQLGQISSNALIGEEPIVGKGGSPRLILYHHGSMPGSLSVVYLIPSLEIVIIVLQNSLPAIDTADLFAQILLEAVLSNEQPNDYIELAHKFKQATIQRPRELRDTLEENRERGTCPKPLSSYIGRYWNDIKNFSIDILERDGNLYMRFQGLDSQTHSLQHYHHDTFSWLMTYDEIAKRARSAIFYSATFYLIDFIASTGTTVDQLKWAADGNFPQEKEIFIRDKSKQNVSW
jgi:CubicO group peptidase (beta-lactamase class C family)